LSESLREILTEAKTTRAHMDGGQTGRKSSTKTPVPALVMDPIERPSEKWSQRSSGRSMGDYQRGAIRYS